MQRLLELTDRKRLLDVPSYYAVELVQDPKNGCMTPASEVEMHALGLRLADDPVTTTKDDKGKAVKLITVAEPPLVFGMGMHNLSVGLAAILTDAEPLSYKMKPAHEWTRQEAAKLIPPGKARDVFIAVSELLTAAVYGEPDDAPAEPPAEPPAEDTPPRPTSGRTGTKKR